MNKKKVLLVFCLLCVTASAVVLSGPTQAVRPQADAPTMEQAVDLPEHVSYKFLFYKIRFLKEQADDIERQGKGKSALLSRFQEEAALNNEQFQKLKDIAFDCERQVDELDQRAKRVIEAYRERYPPGVMQKGKEQAETPPELIAMQQERDAIILRARDRLRVALGDQESARLHVFVRQRVAPHVKLVNRD